MTASAPAMLDRRLLPARPDLADARLRGQVEAARFVEGRPMRVAAPSAPLRRTPRPDGALDTEALMGAPVRAFEDREGWSWAQLVADGYVGYLPTEALGPDGPPPTHRVGVLRTFVYPGPDLKLPVLAHLPFGAGVTPAEGRGAFSRLSEGWVFAAHLRPAGERVLDFTGTAERFVGVPYLWGGRTSLGLDCSGLVQLALEAAGIAAPRDADLQQAALGAPVALEVASRGDLVFWRGHVGIMLDERRLLHANAYHMTVAVEPLAPAAARIEAGGGGPVLEVRRLAEAG